MELAFSKWYPLPYELAMWEVSEAVKQVKLKTLHLDPATGQLMAENKTKMMDVGLVYIRVEVHPESGTVVSLKGEPYVSTFKESMDRPFNQLLWAMDHRMMMRANHFAHALRQTKGKGVRFDLQAGTDLASRRVIMGKPRALGTIVLALLVASMWLFAVMLQDTDAGVMLYLGLASPFLLSAALVAARQFAAGAYVLLIAGFCIGVFFLIFTGLLSVIILLPALKGGSRAFAADVQRRFLERPPEMTHSVARPIIIEHR